VFHQLAYLKLGRIFLIASKIDELLRSYNEYPSKSVSEQLRGVMPKKRS
jgi:hypothetical protein